MKEERFPHTRSAFTGGDCRRRRGEASEPWRRAWQRDAEGKAERSPHRGSVPTSTHPPEKGLGAETRASEVRSQGEDWGWLREHSVKGASEPQLAGRESGKKSGTAKEARDFSLPLCFGVREDRGLRAPLKGARESAQAAAISAHPEDGHETLRLLLQSPRSLCASTGHYPHLPSRSLCSPPLSGSRDPGTTSPGEHTACLRLVQRHTSLCRHRLAQHSVPLPPPGLSEPELPNQLLL